MSFQTIEITTLLEFVEQITKLREKRTPENAEQWFFRGQKNSNWDVRPSVFREDNLATEHLLIDKAQRQNPLEFKECTDSIEVLTKLQHYGLGTRLLDVTLNPLVALYFATDPSSEYVKISDEDFSCKKHDGVDFYGFETSCALKDLNMRIALAIPFLYFGKSMTLGSFLERLRDDKIIYTSEYDKLKSNDYELLINYIQTNSFVVSANSNARLLQQRGAFLITPSINIKPRTNINKSILSKAKSNLEEEFEGKFIIPEDCKESIRDNLDFINVNEATLFPELEHQMLYIQNQARTPVGVVEDFMLYDRETEYQETMSEAKEIIKTYAEILSIVNSELFSYSKVDQEKITKSIEDATEVVDWQKKDSSISRIRRSIKSVLTETMPDDIATEKANDIIKKLLE